MLFAQKGFVVVFWHFFHAHLRPEAFPMDKAMYAGGLPLEEYAHERPVEYERLVKEGKLDGMSAFMTGKLKIEGDMGVAMKLQSILR